MYTRVRGKYVRIHGVGIGFQARLIDGIHEPRSYACMYVREILSEGDLYKRRRVMIVLTKSIVRRDSSVVLPKRINHQLTPNLPGIMRTLPQPKDKTSNHGHAIDPAENWNIIHPKTMILVSHGTRDRCFEL